MFIKGKDLYFYMLIGNENVVLFHARTASINSTSGVLPSTTKNSGNAETNEYSRKYAYTIKVEGLTYIGDQFTGFNLQTAQTSFTKINWTFTDNENVQWYGVALVTSTTFDGDFDNLNSFDAELLGDGEYTFIQSDVPPTPPIGDTVSIIDQFGNVIAVVTAPGTYAVTKFDTIDLRSFNPATDQPITPQIVITA